MKRWTIFWLLCPLSHCSFRSCIKAQRNRFMKLLCLLSNWITNKTKINDGFVTLSLVTRSKVPPLCLVTPNMWNLYGCPYYYMWSCLMFFNFFFLMVDLSSNVSSWFPFFVHLSSSSLKPLVPTEGYTLGIFWNTPLEARKFFSTFYLHFTFAYTVWGSESIGLLFPAWLTLFENVSVALQLTISRGYYSCILPPSTSCQFYLTIWPVYSHFISVYL